MTESNIKVTLGICVKNSESTIKDAIESVLSQDYPYKLMEIIVVDGCSQDNTLKIIKSKLEEANVKVRYFSENEGVALARQIVVENAIGDYIVWVDGDMVISKNFITKHVEFMEQHPSVGIAKGRYIAFLDPKNVSLVAKLENIEFLLETASEVKPIFKSLGASGCIYRVKAIRQIGGFDPQIKHGGEDTDVETRIRERGWSFCISPAFFWETRRQNWKSLWNEYFWHGGSGPYLLKKNRRVYSFYKMFPPTAVLAELFRVPAAYKLTRQVSVLFLPFHYIFKRIALFFGFLKSFLEKSDSRQ